MNFVTAEAQSFKDGIIADCEHPKCDQRAVMVVEFGPDAARVQVARCEGHGMTELTSGVFDTVERVPAGVSR